MARKRTTIFETVRNAVTAHTNLTMFYAIIALAESGGFYGNAGPELSRIIALAKQGAGRQLRLYDAAQRSASKMVGPLAPLASSPEKGEE